MTDSDDVAALFGAERSRLLTLLADFEPADWEIPIPCPGWAVQAMPGRYRLVLVLAGSEVSGWARSSAAVSPMRTPCSSPRAAFIYQHATPDRDR